MLKKDRGVIRGFHYPEGVDWARKCHICGQTSIFCCFLWFVLLWICNIWYIWGVWGGMMCYGCMVVGKWQRKDMIEKGRWHEKRPNQPPSRRHLQHNPEYDHSTGVVNIENDVIRGWHLRDLHQGGVVVSKMPSVRSKIDYLPFLFACVGHIECIGCAEWPCVLWFDWVVQKDKWSFLG